MSEIQKTIEQKNSKDTNQNSIDWYISKGKEATFKDIVEIVWPLSIQEMLTLARNREIFTSEIHEQLAETFGYITNIVKQGQQKTQQSVGDIFDKLKLEIPREKTNLIKLARLLYSAKLFEVVNNNKEK